MPLDQSRLTSRVRALLRGQPGPPGTHDDARPLEEAAPPESGGREIRFVPDADVPLSPDVPTGCAVIERTYAPHVSHGKDTVGDYARLLDSHLGALALLAADPAAGSAGRPSTRAARFEWDERRRPREDRLRTGAPTAGPLLFFDLETTGLSGGVGTLAFLVGCGYFEDGSFRTRQYFLSGYDAENDLLDALAALTREFAGLVTFNGRTFDVPLIEMRYAFHRLGSPFEHLPHFDMLHAARRLWRRRGPSPIWNGPEWSLSAPGGEAPSCSLKSLEEAILGTGRTGDVPGFEIPSRYFGYLRSGDLGPLHAVFEHNRLDLLSLAALTALAARMAAEGPSAVPSPHEALAMGQVYERVGRARDADACYVRAAGLEGSPWEARSVDLDIRVDALRRLALVRRRARRYQEAAWAWEALLESGADRETLQEARRALAIHHEHRTRDLESARAFAESAAGTEQDPDRVSDLRRRLDRLERKRLRGTAGRAIDT